jgi:hypothetical protein
LQLTDHSADPAKSAKQCPPLSLLMSSPRKAELLKWQGLSGPNFSEYAFPKPGHPETHLRDVRAAWKNDLVSRKIA